MINIILALLMAINIQAATVHCVNEDIVCFETASGDCYECYGWVDDLDADYLLVMVDDAVVEFVELPLN